jgi:hypothetical protein
MERMYRRDLSSGLNVLGLQGIEIELEILDRRPRGQPIDELIQSLEKVTRRITSSARHQAKRNQVELAAIGIIRTLASLSQTSETPLRDSASRQPSHGGKPARQHKNYRTIDKALHGCAKAQPKEHKEVFNMLDDRKVPIPGGKLFQSAGGWRKGFQRNPSRARAWLSQRWGKLGLPAFPRGPKK